jgi:hypothetical protein
MGQEVNAVEDLKVGEEQNAPEELKALEKPKADEELRRAPRLQCSGLAGIQTLPAVEKPCPAKIINLSIGGCLMESEKPLTLGLDEIVELIFCVNHMPFRVRGKVRAIRSQTVIGFQFPQLSDRVRMQLQDLVGELIEHLAKLHKESMARQPAQEDGKHPQLPTAVLPLGAMNRPVNKAAQGLHGSAAHTPEPHRRWF